MNDPTTNLALSESVSQIAFALTRMGFTSIDEKTKEMLQKGQYFFNVYEAAARYDPLHPQRYDDVGIQYKKKFEEIIGRDIQSSKDFGDMVDLMVDTQKIIRGDLTEISLEDIARYKTAITNHGCLMLLKTAERDLSARHTY